MGGGRYLVIIASVVASAAAANIAAAHAKSHTTSHTTSHDKPPVYIAARVEVLIRKNIKNSEIVRFAGRSQRPVRVVRGKAEPTAAHGSDETIAFADRRHKPVRVLRGPVVADVAVVLPTVAPVPRQAAGTIQVVAFASRLGGPVTVLRGAPVARVDPDLPAVDRYAGLGLFGAAARGDLDRVAFAVDGAESSHGADLGMWRPEWSGPQGPMQVSEAAAIDSGGGDRFDLTENRMLGRAYLARLYRRYGNWPDAVAAYNWGPGNMDAWIAQGRPVAGLPLEVEHYCDRVLRDGGIAGEAGGPLLRAGWAPPVP